MTAPLNRDQQIELMLGSKDRHETRFAAWMANRTVRAVVSKPAPGQDDGTLFSHETRRAACC
ncbi:hypothetical protein ASE75_10655 [Sphingomonas sp. Leaf17]|uniref:hypothetical protein n=1 Tax=Sphingomonas sp. Leaf17 TaxID=1735683 RepID=UPI0007019A35|nr:hypothetical protein [Sphingomonas sp. Leaf17]KQM64418.1 hypothetical protein ASE75_10655 [Sphingomonas sp. Leaf17]